MSTIDREQKSGLFIVNYNIAKPGVLGGYNLQLKLTVYPPARRISGEAIITHATLQPLVFDNPIQGHYEEAGGNIELFLSGFNDQGENFHFDGQLKGGWQADGGSKARYAFQQNGHWTEVTGQDVQLSDQLSNALKALNLR